MFRSMSRNATAVAVVLVLVLASVPAAQASPLSGPSFDTRAGWFDAALSWLSGLLFGDASASSQQFRPVFEAAKSSIDGSSMDGFATPTSGSGIDPEGGNGPRP